MGLFTDFSRDNLPFSFFFFFFPTDSLSVRWTDRGCCLRLSDQLGQSGGTAATELKMAEFGQLKISFVIFFMIIFVLFLDFFFI